MMSVMATVADVRLEGMALAPCRVLHNPSRMTILHSRVMLGEW